jgi:hypothetical protein
LENETTVIAEESARERGHGSRIVTNRPKPGLKITKAGGSDAPARRLKKGGGPR